MFIVELEGHSSLVSHAFDLEIFVKFTFMKMFSQLHQAEFFLPSKHIIGLSFFTNSFIFKIVVLCLSTVLLS